MLTNVHLLTVQSELVLALRARKKDFETSSLDHGRVSMVVGA